MTSTRALAVANFAGVATRTLVGAPAWVVLGQVFVVNSISMAVIVGLVLLFAPPKQGFEPLPFIYGYALCWSIGALGWGFSVLLEDRWWRLYGREFARTAELLRMQLSPPAGLGSTCTLHAWSHGRLLEIRFQKSMRLMTTTMILLFDADSPSPRRREPPICPKTAEEIADLIRRTALEEGFELPGIDARAQAV